ncbi:hypothetical protein MHYP_G00280850 [Metynnis hypsauchen]
MYDKRDRKSIDLCFLSILNMYQQHPTVMKTGVATALPLELSATQELYLITTLERNARISLRGQSHDTKDQAFLRAPRQPAGRLATEGRLAASSTLRQPKEKPQATESYSTPPFDHRLITGRPPSSQASSPGRQETEVGYQLRRLTCLKPQQDIWDRHWKPECEPTGSQARFPSLRIQSPVSQPQSKAGYFSFMQSRSDAI